MFSGGGENWTEDQSTYIGGIYTAELYETPVTIYITCDADALVSSVSLWISDGAQAVSEEQLTVWQGYVSDATGVSMEASTRWIQRVLALLHMRRPMKNAPAFSPLLQDGRPLGEVEVNPGAGAGDRSNGQVVAQTTGDFFA